MLLFTIMGYLQKFMTSMMVLLPSEPNFHQLFEMYEHIWYNINCSKCKKNLSLKEICLSFFSVGFSKVVTDISKTDQTLVVLNHITLIDQMEKTCSKDDIIISLNHFDQWRHLTGYHKFRKHGNLDSFRTQEFLLNYVLQLYKHLKNNNKVYTNVISKFNTYLT